MGELLFICKLYFFEELQVLHQLEMDLLPFKILLLLNVQPPLLNFGVADEVELSNHFD